jgi:hypothetical protein
MELVTQAEAGRIRGCSRQRINTLIRSGYLEPVDVKGRLMLYRDKVESLKTLSVGRPRLVPKIEFSIGDIGIYTFPDNSGVILAEILTIEEYRLRVRYKLDNDTYIVWARKQDFALRNS